MSGGTGDDLYYVDDSMDVIAENVDEGTDTVYAAATYQLSLNVEGLVLTGTEAIDGYGTPFDNDIYGNAAANFLNGRSGDDYISGGDGDDLLKGATGNDTLVGGNGYDTVKFAGDMATYSIITSGGSVSVRDDEPNLDFDNGIDTIESIEELKFKDGSVSISPPIILDLADDGIETVSAAKSAAKFDLDRDGLADDTSWIGSGDAFLYLDRNGDGTMTGADELSFVGDLAGAATDLAGLAAFDSDADGLLTAVDERELLRPKPDLHAIVDFYA